MAQIAARRRKSAKRTRRTQRDQIVARRRQPRRQRASSPRSRERLETVEHAQVDPAQLAHISDTVDGSTRLNAAPETTGSIASAVPGDAARAAAPRAEVTDRVLEDWVVEDVHGNRALVASRYGGNSCRCPAACCPALGRVERSSARMASWVVVTAKGMITRRRVDCRADQRQRRQRSRGRQRRLPHVRLIRRVRVATSDSFVGRSALTPESCV